MVLSSVLVVAMDHWILNANIHARNWGKRTGSLFFLDKEILILKQQHPYFYQIQLQMLLTNT